VGEDGQCLIGPCPDAEAAIWTSSDGRSWSRLLANDLFRVNEPSDPGFTVGASATAVVAWGSHVVVGGNFDGKPVIWISDPERSGSGLNAPSPGLEGAPASIQTEGPSSSAPSIGTPARLAGSWEATDPPPDSSHLTMEVIALADGTYDVTIRDDVASVCGGVSSTMSGIAEESEAGTIVIAQPQYLCDDGSEPRALSGPPLGEQLQNLGFTYDAGNDVSLDSFGLVWSRVAMGA
jgi:hypothetical protein